MNSSTELNEGFEQQLHQALTTQQDLENAQALEPVMQYTLIEASMGQPDHQIMDLKNGKAAAPRLRPQAASQLSLSIDTEQPTAEVNLSINEFDRYFEDSGMNATQHTGTSLGAQEHTQSLAPTFDARVTRFQHNLPTERKHVSTPRPPMLRAPINSLRSSPNTFTKPSQIRIPATGGQVASAAASRSGTAVCASGSASGQVFGGQLF